MTEMLKLYCKMRSSLSRAEILCIKIGEGARSVGFEYTVPKEFEFIL